MRNEYIPYDSFKGSKCRTNLKPTQSCIKKILINAERFLRKRKSKCKKQSLKTVPNRILTQILAKMRFRNILSVKGSADGITSRRNVAQAVKVRKTRVSSTVLAVSQNSLFFTWLKTVAALLCTDFTAAEKTGKCQSFTCLSTF